MTQQTAMTVDRADDPVPVDDPVVAEPGRPRHTLVVIAAFCLVLCVTQVLMLDAAEWDPWPILLWESILGLYFVSGLIALWRQPHNPFGTLLILAGLGQWCAGLQTVPSLGLSMIGFLTSTLPLALMIHLILAFPNGRLPSRAARVAVIGAYLTSSALEVPLLLLSVTSPLRVVDSEPAALLGICVTVQRLAGLGCLLLAIVVIWTRWITMKRDREVRLAPFTLYGLACLIGMTLTVLTKLSGELSISSPDILKKIPELQAVLIAFLPVVFLVGVLTGSFGRTGELREFLTGIGGRMLSPRELDIAVGRAVGVPGCRVIYAAESGTGFVEADGPAVRDAADGENRYPIRYRGTVVGAIVYRPAPEVDPRLLESVAEASAVVISHRRTVASLQAALLDLRRTDRALRQSRRRLALAGDRERRRIARDLHDGLQQNAIMLGMRAEQLQAADQDPTEMGRSARAVRDGVVGLLSELRNLIQGIMPAPLVERGIVSAIKALPGQFPVPVQVDIRGPARRLPAEIESTIYFCVLEAVTNAVKHAHASTIGVALTMTQDMVTAEIGDDGRGGAMPAAGTGLVGLRDRLSAFGGTLTLTSDLGSGTRLRMSIPCG